MKNNGLALQWAPELSANQDIVRAAVRNNGFALEFAPSLNSNTEVVAEAVRNNGRAIVHASEEMRADKYIALLAVAHHSSDRIGLKFVSPELKKDKHVVLKALSKDAWPIRHADEHLRRDQDFMLAAVRQNKRVYDVLEPELRSNPKIKRVYNRLK